MMTRPRALRRQAKRPRRNRLEVRRNRPSLADDSTRRIETAGSYNKRHGQAAEKTLSRHCPDDNSNNIALVVFSLHMQSRTLTGAMSTEMRSASETEIGRIVTARTIFPSITGSFRFIIFDIIR